MSRATNTVGLNCLRDVQALRETITVDARYYVVGDRDVWMIKFEDGEYGPYASRDEAVVFAIDAAQKLGARGGVRACVRSG